MKLTHIFSDTPEDAAHSSLSTDFELPNAALQLPDCRERVLKVTDLVGQLTQVVLHVTCKELDLRYHPIKLERQENASIRYGFRDTLLRFERLVRLHPKHQHLKVIAPIPCPVFYRTPKSREKGSKSLDRFLMRPGDKTHNIPDQQPYLDIIHALAEECLVLLNAEPPTDISREWSYVGFHPAWLDKRAVTNANKAISKRMKAERAAARRLAKQTENPSPAPTSTDTPKTGAGRRYGAVPGMFKGVQFRSQLEIRFVTQLEEWGIRWVYESERLGDGAYLLDFHLPDLKCWIEVKGQFEARDNFLLKEVADYLKRERGERLFVYAQSKAYAVSPKAFRQMTHQEFWSKILSTR